MWSKYGKWMLVCGISIWGSDYYKSRFLKKWIIEEKAGKYSKRIPRWTLYCVPGGDPGDLELNELFLIG